MHDRYENPLITRYAGKEMAHIFSDDVKFKTWRALWIALAEAEHEMGLPVTRAQVDELKAHADDINYEVAAQREKEVRHDVMAHVHAYGVQCPGAKGIIHLGATSCFVGDNTDVIVMDRALGEIETKLLSTLARLKGFALRHADQPTLGYTHYQPAQLTTVGKRATLWMQDLLMDWEHLKYVRSQMKLRGLKGTTGTQASFLALFDGDGEKVKELERRVVEKMGYGKAFAVTGQTYPRKLDSLVVDLLSHIAQSAYKFSNDMRLLQSMKEMEEPFEKSQIGSSAMAYKRNPMRSERISALSRYVLSLAINPAVTAGTQWFERTLDDSANKRLVIPQAFLAVDAILNIYLNVAQGMVVYDKVIEKRVMEELPFMATETILMEAVRRGGDRQELHEKIRTYSMQAGRRVKQQGLENNLIDLIKQDGAFKMSAAEIDAIMDPKGFTGRAGEQVREFIAGEVAPILEKYQGRLDAKGQVNI